MNQYLLCPNCDLDELQGISFEVEKENEGGWLGAVVGGMMGGFFGAIIGKALTTDQKLRITCNHCGYFYETEDGTFFVRIYKDE